MQQSCLHGSIDSCPKFPPLPLGIKPISHNLQPFQLTKWTHPSQPPILIISTQNWLGTSLRFFKPERRKQLYILFFCLQPLLIWKFHHNVHFHSIPSFSWEFQSVQLECSLPSSWNSLGTPHEESPLKVVPLLFIMVGKLPPRTATRIIIFS